MQSRGAIDDRTRAPDAETEAIEAENAELLVEIEAARSRAERLERILNTVPGVVWDSDGSLGQPADRTTYAGGQIERILGYSREQWMTEPAFWSSAIHPENKPKTIEAIAALASGERAPIEHRFVANDGRDVWVDVHAADRRDRQGSVIGRGVLLLDVTERVAAERARDELLERSLSLSERLDELIASVPGVVWEISTRSDAAASAPAFFSAYLEIMTGYVPDEAVADPFFIKRLTHPDDRARASRELDQILARGAGVIQCRWVTKDGRSLWVESHIRALRGDDGAPIRAHGVTLDITEHKLAEEARSRLRDELIQAQGAALLELSTPIIPVSPGVLVAPLIGAIDEQQVLRFIEALLRGVARSAARIVIIDITGVAEARAEIAGALLRAARAARLLGAEAVLTGVRPAVARGLLALSADNENIIVRSTLQRGIAYAARRCKEGPAAGSP